MAERCLRDKKLLLGVILLTVFVLLSVLVPVLSPYEYDTQNVNDQNLGSSLVHWFGTDKFGRDLFTRVFYGMRISLWAGFISTAVCLVLGVLIGSAAGYCGGVTDTILVEVMNVMSAIPSMLYVILITLIFDASIGSVVLGICISGWIDLGKMVRAETKRQRQQDYCVAAEMMGIPPWRVIFVYILKNEREMLIVQTILLIPKAIFTEAFLSFLGIGIAAPKASLGTLIQDARSQIAVCPAQMVYPVLMLAVLMVYLQGIGYAMERRSAVR